MIRRWVPAGPEFKMTAWLHQGVPARDSPVPWGGGPEYPSGIRERARNRKTAARGPFAHD